MLRRDSTFKISKETKRVMATINDKNQRDVFKALMIKAQIEGSRVIASKKNKEVEDEG
jgi:hypothetical protein